MAKKRKRSVNQADEIKPEDAAKEEAHVTYSSADQAKYGEKLTPYELQRQQLIEQNRARLLALGIPMAVVGLQEVVHKSAEARRPTPTALCTRPPATSSSGPVRRSSRLKEHAQQQQEADEALSQGNRDLAMFIIDGECPKCGKILRNGHRQHLAACKGLPEPTEEEKAQQAEQRRKRNENKLLALSLRGLVDFTEEHAKFIVIGSTGTPYPVTLRTGKHSCACVDHRVRKHDCKHIRLILKQLDIENQPDNWRQAVQQHFSSQLPGAPHDGGGAAAWAATGTAKQEATATVEAQSPKPSSTGERDAGQPRSSKRCTPRSLKPDAAEQQDRASTNPNRAEALKFM